jgi:hypothetical protein
VKLLKMKSIEGMSPNTFLIMMYTFSSSVSNALILHWKQIQQCQDDALQCQPSLLSLYQLLAMLLCTSPFVFYALRFHAEKASPEYRRLQRQVAVATLYSATVLTVSAVSSAVEPCTPWLVTTANVLGLCATVGCVVQWLPQVQATYRTKDTGAVSLFAFAIQVAGGFLLAYFQIFGTRERWSTWLPNLCGTFLMAAILGMCCYYSCHRNRYRGLGTEEKAGADTERGGRGHEGGDVDGDGDGGEGKAAGDFARLHDGDNYDGGAGGGGGGGDCDSTFTSIGSGGRSVVEPRDDARGNTGNGAGSSRGAEGTGPSLPVQREEQQQGKLDEPLLS